MVSTCEAVCNFEHASAIDFPTELVPTFRSSSILTPKAAGRHPIAKWGGCWTLNTLATTNPYHHVTVDLYDALFVHTSEIALRDIIC
jgi:hypothetical protein